MGRGGLIVLLRLDLGLLIVYMALYSVKSCLNKMLIQINTDAGLT